MKSYRSFPFVSKLVTLNDLDRGGDLNNNRCALSLRQLSFLYAI